MRHRAVATSIVVAVVAAACGSASRDASQPATEVTTAEDGIRRIEVPLPPRQNPLVLPMGDRVLVFGGYRYEDGDARPVKPRGDGAVYDARRDTWTRTPPLPVPAPFRQAVGVWTGEEVVLLGTPCAAAGGDEGRNDCRPGGVAAVAFSPARGTWRVVEGVRPPAGFEAGTGNAVESTGLGWTGSDAAFSVSNANGGASILLVDVARGSSRWVPDVPARDTTCVAGGRLLAVQTGRFDAHGGFLALSPTAVAHPLRTVELDASGTQWRPLPALTPAGAIGAAFERVACADGQLVYLPVRPPPEGFGAGGLWWDPDRTAWEPIPGLGALGFPGEPRIAAVSGTKIIWFIHGSVAALPRGSDRWILRPVPTQLPVRIAGVAGKLLVDTTSSERDAQLTLGFMELASLEQPAG